MPKRLCTWTNPANRDAYSSRLLRGSGFYILQWELIRRRVVGSIILAPIRLARKRCLTRFLPPSWMVQLSIKPESISGRKASNNGKWHPYSDPDWGTVRTIWRRLNRGCCDCTQCYGCGLRDCRGNLMGNDQGSQIRIRECVVAARPVG